MSLDTVAEDVTEDARERAERIRTEADERAEEIIAEAESDAEEIIEEREREVETQIEQERDQTRSSANLEAKQKRLEARRDVLADVREEVASRIVDLSGDEREELTRTLLDNAAAEFAEDASVRVFGRAEDAELLESLAEEYEGYEYAGEYDCLGGVVAESETSRVRVNNTFDSVLDSVWDDELGEISRRLFEQ